MYHLSWLYIELIHKYNTFILDWAESVMFNELIKKLYKSRFSKAHDPNRCIYLYWKVINMV